MFHHFLNLQPSSTVHNRSTLNFTTPQFHPVTNSRNTLQHVDHFTTYLQLHPHEWRNIDHVKNNNIGLKRLRMHTHIISALLYTGEIALSFKLQRILIEIMSCKGTCQKLLALHRSFKDHFRQGVVFQLNWWNIHDGKVLFLIYFHISKWSETKGSFIFWLEKVRQGSWHKSNVPVMYA